MCRVQYASNHPSCDLLVSPTLAMSPDEKRKMEERMNGAEAIADILKREGTEFLTCYPRQPLIETSAKVGIRPVLCH